MPFYVRQRTKIEERIPWLSLLVMVGYGISIIAMIVTATTSCFLVWA